MEPRTINRRTIRCAVLNCGFCLYRSLRIRRTARRSSTYVRRGCALKLSMNAYTYHYYQGETKKGRGRGTYVAHRARGHAVPLHDVCARPRVDASAERYLSYSSAPEWFLVGREGDVQRLRAMSSAALTVRLLRSFLGVRPCGTGTSRFTIMRGCGGREGRAHEVG